MVPGLWLGGLSSAESDADLLERRIFNVITMAARLKPEAAWTSFDSHRIVVTHIEIDDHPCADLLGHLRPALKALDRSKTKLALGDAATNAVLVHCASGISRSVSVCVAWLMIQKGWPFADALQLVKNARPAASPNYGFEQCLHLLETCGNDLNAAHTAWRKSNKEHRRTRHVKRLRKAADKLYSRISDLEERVTSRQEEAKSDSFHKRLRRLLEQAETSIPMMVVDDTYARDIRQLAAEKAQRLLMMLPPESCTETFTKDFDPTSSLDSDQMLMMGKELHIADGLPVMQPNASRCICPSVDKRLSFHSIASL